MKQIIIIQIWLLTEYNTTSSPALVVQYKLQNTSEHEHDPAANTQTSLITNIDWGGQVYTWLLALHRACTMKCPKHLPLKTSLKSIIKCILQAKKVGLREVELFVQVASFEFYAPLSFPIKYSCLPLNYQKWQNHCTYSIFSKQSLLSFHRDRRIWSVQCRRNIALSTVIIKAFLEEMGIEKNWDQLIVTATIMCCEGVRRLLRDQ